MRGRKVAGAWPRREGRVLQRGGGELRDGGPLHRQRLAVAREETLEPLDFFGLRRERGDRCGGEDGARQEGGQRFGEPCRALARKR